VLVLVLLLAAAEGGRRVGRGRTPSSADAEEEEGEEEEEEEEGAGRRLFVVGRIDEVSREPFLLLSLPPSLPPSLIIYWSTSLSHEGWVALPPFLPPSLPPSLPYLLLLNFTFARGMGCPKSLAWTETGGEVTGW
jgi:hypothetical protein